TPDALKHEIAGDVVTIGLNGSTPVAAQLLDGAEFVRKLETPEQGGLRLYVDNGAVAIPAILRALDGEGIAPPVDRAAPAEPRRRVPDQDRPFTAGKLRRRRENRSGHLVDLPTP